MTDPRFSILCTLALLALPTTVAAHPVPKNTHDRTLTVSMACDEQIVRVAYRLEVDELTAFTRDLEPYADDIDAARFRGRPEKLYGELARRLGPDLAFRLTGKLNGQRLDFACTQHKASLHDDTGTPLGHLRMDFGFAARGSLRLDRDNELKFRDQTYLGEEGKIDLSFTKQAGLPLPLSCVNTVGLMGSSLGQRPALAAGALMAARAAPLRMVRSVMPEEAIKERSPLEREPGDDDRLRELHVVFRLPGTGSPPQTAETPFATALPPATPQAGQGHGESSLVWLLLHTDYGFVLTMLVACVLGAGHALTPGHGKTLVAAYLVGERGTVGHAIVLGLVTTLTHTGAVLLIAAILYFLPGDARESFGRMIQDGLGLGMGLIVVCMGFWLLLQRLSGRADHFHVGGGHHHHHPHGVEPNVAGSATGGVRWWGLIVLGITGGLVPCWDAIYVLVYAVGRNMFGVALPAVLAFSAGLAGVLVLVGVLVVQVPHFARSRWGNGRVVRALPIISAVLVTLMGVWLCYEGVHGQ
jgi:ABC-type nickel/cobalt efflux system permease component RcnA